MMNLLLKVLPVPGHWPDLAFLSASCGDTDLLEASYGEKQQK